jgi:hypothetical protein
MRVNFIVVLEPSRQQSDYGLSVRHNRQPSIIAFEGFDECLRDAVGFRRADWRETKGNRTLMPRWPFGARDTCESCKSLDVRHLHRRGRLSAGQTFSWAWTSAGAPSGSIRVHTQPDALILSYCTRHFLGDVKDTEQRVPITWTACHFGGRRPWFICSARVDGRYCGRRVAVLYLGGEVFACRKCCGLAYESQQGGLQFRKLRKAQAIRLLLGGIPDPFAPFPAKPRRMHLRTYRRLRAQTRAAEAISLGRR